MLKVSRKQAQKLGLSARSRLSPHLEKCCVLLSANVSYAHAAQDLEVLTGVKVSPSTQQRLVHRYEFAEPPVQEAVETLGCVAKTEGGDQLRGLCSGFTLLHVQVQPFQVATL